MAYPDEVLADSPLRYWRLSETGGSTVTDEVASATGNVEGGTDLNVAGPMNLGSAAEFDGVNGRIETASVLTSLPVTLEGWVNTTDAAGWGTVYAEIDSTDNTNTIQLTDSGDGGVVEGSIRSTSPYDGSFVRGATNIADGEWHHVVAVFEPDGAGGTDITVYVDGQQDGSGSVSWGFPTGLGNGAMGVLPRSSPIDILDGAVDEVAIYDTVLSATRIEAHYDAATVAATPVGLATETDTAQPIGTAKAKTLDQPSETDLAQPITSAKSYTLGQATSTETAQPITARKTYPIGQATETDTALAVTVFKTYTLGLAAETDTALTLVTGEPTPPIVLPPYRESAVPDYQEAAVPAYREPPVPAYQESAS